MRAVAKVAKWGDSLVVKLPDGLVEALDLREGDKVEIAAGAQTPQLWVCKSDKLAGLKAFRGRLPVGFLFNRNEANGRD
ncbi:AbrB/MazE/SpoVT family DNA-binding domain-containing protein [Pseudomonas aeruginosa]|uniref:AbrB/MazE/SpoVT family DNA-binding domain-containing protein n=1 Tax=Pseudomonas aeruginosa TaxID=287 RepID=UPI000F7EC9ED|nr:AbrB family transcriptional regulator [Pseudomonas aeruginosa]RTB44150.1 AbrB family transcriptional regulator [Pseudomonas aeruginosa]